MRKINEGKMVTVFHLGDRDPSGIDMTRDNRERLEMFTGSGNGDGNLHVVRLALNMEQVKKRRPPPNPAKMTDSRFGGYATEYGNQSWELDALDPKTIDALITSHVRDLINDDAWASSLKRENAGIKTLEKFAEQAA